MDQDVAAAIADLRYQLAQLRSALGAKTPDDAEEIVGQLVTTVEALGTGTTQTINSLQGEVSSLTNTGGQLFTAINAIEAQVQALIRWAVTVTPPFTG